jgi:non-ribosomal peptide synthetase component F
MATQVVSRVREVFGVELALRTIFEQPTVAAIGEGVEALLRVDDQNAVAPIVAVSRPERIPLSFAQERLWFLDQLEPETAIYNVPVALRLTGSLNLAVLEETLTEIVRRHESLRTSFPQANSQPYQQINEATEVKVPVLDLSGFADREGRAREIVAAEARQPFDLSNGPLFRARLVQLEPEEYLLMFTMHHIISDGWSVGVLVREVTSLYQAFIKGETSPLRELSIQYADFSIWQREYLAGKVADDELTYWKTQLAGAPPLLELPTDRPRPAIQTYSGARHSFMLSSEASEELKALGRRESVTLFMLLLASFKVLLYYYTKQTDIVVGADIANRNRGVTENLIGFFVNMLVTRTQLSRDLGFQDLLANVRETALEAFAHQETPFEKIVEELQPVRDIGYNPLFQVAFVLQNVPRYALELDGLTITLLEREFEVAKFDLLLDVMEFADGLSVSFVYNTDLWNDSSIRHMSDLFSALLREIVSRPQATVDELAEFLTDLDRQQQFVKQHEFKTTRLLKLKNVRPQPVAVP